MKSNAIYIHGVGLEAGPSPIRQLRKRCPMLTWTELELDDDSYDNMNRLNQIIEKEDPWLVIGHSIGALHVACAKLAHSVRMLCNPILNLDERLSEVYAKFKKEHRLNRGGFNYAFFSAHDELVGDAAILDNMTKVSRVVYSIVVGEGNTHGMDDSMPALLDTRLRAWPRSVERHKDKLEEM